MGLPVAHPEWLPLLWSLVGVATFGLAVATAERRARMQRLRGQPRVGALGELLLVASLAIIAIGLAGPLLGTRTVTVSTSGVDVVLLFDVSRSMDATDVAPSRSTRARAAAARVLGGLSAADRVALAAYAGRGVLLTPLTPDKQALADMLPALDAQLIQPGGSDLPNGILAALGAFEDASARPRVVLLLADGESSSSDFDAAVAALRRADVRWVAALVGSDEGGPIPDHGAWLRDDRGEVAHTRRSPARANELAAATRGQVLLANEWGEFDRAALLAAVRADAGAAPGELMEREVVAASTLPFAAAALALLALEALTAGRRHAPASRLTLFGGERRSAPAAAAVALLAAFLATAPSTSSGTPPGEPLPPTVDPRRLLREGLGHVEAERWEAAEQAFRAAAVLARDGRTASVAYHDLGVAALARDDFATARDAFFDSLALSPGRPETRYNLEWAILALERDSTSPDRSLLDDPAPDPAANDAAAQDAQRIDPPPDDDSTTGDSLGESNHDEDEGKKGEEEGETDAGESTRASGSPEPQDRKPLSPAQRERWLDRVQDDASAALRSAAAPEPGAPRQGFGTGARW